MSTCCHLANKLGLPVKIWCPISGRYCIEFIFFTVNFDFLPNYHLEYCDEIFKLFYGMTCKRYVSLEIGLILTLSYSGFDTLVSCVSTLWSFSKRRIVPEAMYAAYCVQTI